MKLPDTISSAEVEQLAQDLHGDDYQATTDQLFERLMPLIWSLARQQAGQQYRELLRTLVGAGLEGLDNAVDALSDVQRTICAFDFIQRFVGGRMENVIDGRRLEGAGQCNGGVVLATDGRAPFAFATRTAGHRQRGVTATPSTPATE